MPSPPANPDTDRVILVTGAGKGLGAAFAAAWARRGAKVIVNNRHGGSGEPSAESLAASLSREGHDAIADLHAVDAPGAAQAMVDAAINNYGRLDALILNAGIAGPAAKIPGLPEAALREVMEINFFANARLVDAALPYVATAPAGRILLVSSTAGLHGVRGRSAYAASKGALIAWGLSLADEQRPSTRSQDERKGVGVNILCPYAATAMTQGLTADARLVPEGAAAGAIWLTSAACAATGEIWVTGGGHFRRAQAMESRGGGDAAATPEWFAANAAALSDMTGARGYTDGTAAFADFYRDVGK